MNTCDGADGEQPRSPSHSKACHISWQDTHATLHPFVRQPYTLVAHCVCEVLPLSLEKISFKMKIGRGGNEE